MGADGPRSVLIVEDHPDYAEMLALSLSSTGRFTPSVVHDGFAGLERIAEDRPDLVLLDHGLPGISGLEVVRLARQSYPGPIIMHSGDTRPEVELEAIRSGVDDFVDKQASVKVLLARIDAVMRRTCACRRCRSWVELLIANPGD